MLSPGPSPRVEPRSIRLDRRHFADIPRSTWDRLQALTTAASPFSSWTFHRAWWDAYGAAAEEHYLVLEAGAPDRRHGATLRAPDIAAPGSADTDGEVLAIVPLMLRSEPGAGQRTLAFAASYHADYATVLASESSQPLLADVLASYLVERFDSGDIERVDLRRLRLGDGFPQHLRGAWADAAPPPSLTLRLEVEDVCPAIELPADWAALLARLDKKTRHEVRRKLRRAERAGHLELRYLPLGPEAADGFIRLHQARWGAAGLFGDSEDGRRSRLFLRRLAELEGAEGPSAGLHLGEVTMDGRPIYTLAGFAAAGTCYFYNAGLDPEVLDLSPGIVGTAMYVRDRIERGDRRFDFLRGDEAYKYDWGAVDTRLDRLVIRRDGRA